MRIRITQGKVSGDLSAEDAENCDKTLVTREDSEKNCRTASLISHNQA